MKNLLTFLSNFKAWILILLFLIGVGVAFGDIAKLPKKIDDVAAKEKATESNVQKLSSDIDKYIAINEAQRQADKESKDLMLKLIEQNNKKGR